MLRIAVLAIVSMCSAMRAECLEVLLSTDKESYCEKEPIIFFCEIGNPSQQEVGFQFTDAKGRVIPFDISLKVSEGDKTIIDRKPDMHFLVSVPLLRPKSKTTDRVVLKNPMGVGDHTIRMMVRLKEGREGQVQEFENQVKVRIRPYSDDEFRIICRELFRKATDSISLVEKLRCIDKIAAIDDPAAVRVLLSLTSGHLYESGCHVE